MKQELEERPGERGRGELTRWEHWEKDASESQGEGLLEEPSLHTVVSGVQPPEPNLILSKKRNVNSEDSPLRGTDQRASDGPCEASAPQATRCGKSLEQSTVKLYMAKHCSIIFSFSPAHPTCSGLETMEPTNLIYFHCWIPDLSRLCLLPPLISVLIHCN